MTTRAPPTTSECPPRYFVVEWTTTSAPSVSGCCRYGDANVLSTTSSAPASCAASARARMSAMPSSGFVGVSAHTSVVFRPASRARTAATSAIGTTSWLSPQPANTRANNRYVPPYASSGTSTWSPGAQTVLSRQSSAAIPEAKASPLVPDSSAVRHCSSAVLVGLADREYS